MPNRKYCPDCKDVILRRRASGTGIGPAAKYAELPKIKDPEYICPKCLNQWYASELVEEE
jgi:hypothetical protein